VLEQSVAAAQAMGLDGASARNFFAVQIRMARNIQSSYIDRWQAQNPAQVPVGRDLATELRPALDNIGRDLLTAVYLASADLPRALQDQRVLDRLKRFNQFPGIDAELLSELHAALAAIRIDGPPTISRVKRVGMLRIGTTGDYAPFSNEHDNVLSGFDIDLAMRLGQHFGVDVKFVRTTWLSLMNDFKQHRFDVAMSGISITPERSALASFSIPYHADGKAPIARCKDVGNFTTLEQIDKSTVRVIENSGGTNERFARDQLKHATILVHADNRTVFDEILAGRADVMFTDSIEVDLQVRRHPQLCRAISLPLTQAKKAVMMPTKGWESEINEWLLPKLASGEIEEQLQQALLDAK
jgi:cyclohexadienyl dehydratase